MVQRIPATIGVFTFKHREINHPQEAPAGFNQAQILPNFQA
jgi:hypothetical protein